MVGVWEIWQVWGLVFGGMFCWEPSYCSHWLLAVSRGSLLDVCVERGVVVDWAVDEEPAVSQIFSTVDLH